jgi:carbonic anhydrase
VDNWLRHVRNIARRREDELAALSPADALDRLCEINVLSNAENVARTTIVEDAWERGQPLQIHSWAYRLDTGRINVLDQPITA